MKRRGLLAWIGLVAALVAAPFVLWMSLRGADARNLQCEQSVYEFGEVAADAVIEHEFVFRNVGREKVTGLQEMSGCGCISTELSNQSVDPGATARAFVRLEVKTLHGAVEMKVYVGGEKGRPVTLTLRGIVREQ
jgi:hypothetical protein